VEHFNQLAEWPHNSTFHGRHPETTARGPGFALRHYFVDQATNAVVPLTTLAPAPSGTAQSLTVNLPYRHLSGTIRLREFDNVGNEGTPASVSVSVPKLC